ncbi:hypothetical protein G6F50_016210 [Rhizopus delemar]|uniref:Uncharacterized protein n=1 Tax=Rhizopus delemar TaxID=936053 RepID=A0A9P6XTV9_9FUNG|nr:hypothetical protein G6F50_016210 [Rhizopus delemar]
MIPQPVRFQRIHFALVGGAHGAARAVQQGGGVAGRVAAAGLQEFGHAGIEDAGQGALFVAARGHGLLQHGQVAARPEVVFKAAGLGMGALDGKALGENVGPGHDRDAQQHQHDQLDRHAGVRNQRKQRHVAGGLHGYS